MNKNPSKDSVEVKPDYDLEQFKILYSTFQTNVDIYFRGSSMYLIIVLASLGFILKGEIPDLYSRIVALIIIVMGLMWYLGNIKALKYADNLEKELMALSEKLGISYSSTPFLPGRTIVKLAMFTAFPILVTLIYLLFKPSLK